MTTTKRAGSLNLTTHATTEARDAVLATPMERGVAEAYDKLAELLK